METKVTFCFVLFSRKRLMTLRSPLTTSVNVDQSPSMTSDGQTEGARTTKGIFRGERTCDFEFWLWLCHHCLFSDCTRVRMQGVISPYSFDSQRQTHMQKRREC